MTFNFFIIRYKMIKIGIVFFISIILYNTEHINKMQ